MFGRGIYLTEVASKAALYCHATAAQPFGYLVLARVALGNELHVTRPDASLESSSYKIEGWMHFQSTFFCCCDTHWRFNVKFLFVLHSLFLLDLIQLEPLVNSAATPETRWFGETVLYFAPVCTMSCFSQRLFDHIMKGGIVVNNFSKSQDMDISSRALMYDENVVHDATQVFYAHIAVLHLPFWRIDVVLYNRSR